ncbi:hypothetical protein JCM3770_004680 [Rhodotorula araucariae]
MADALLVHDTAQKPLSPRQSAKRPSPARDSLPGPSHKRVALDTAAAPPAAPPPLTTQKDAAGGASAANGGGGAVAAAGCRLLWRGRLTSEQGRALHGVAIVAHLFSVSSALSPPPPTAASSLSPFDDPFSSASSATASGADMCLGLEMLRGAPIAVKGAVRVRTSGSPAAAEKAPLSSAGRKGKVRARDGLDVEVVDVETPTDVRVYIDGRCPETVEWFEDAFCREGRDGCGVTLDAGGEEVILFASLPNLASLAELQENVDPAASTSSQPPRPPLTLLLGRRARATARKPRPDDPLPRENLFANKLRKTTSLPASAFALSADPAPAAKKPKRQTAKDKAIASLLGKKDDPAMVPPRSRARAASSQPPGIAFPAPPPAAPRPFARSASSRFPSSATGPLARQASLPPLAGAAAAPRRSSVSAGAPGAAPHGRAFQRTLSRSSMLLDSPPGSDADDDVAEIAPRRRASPTPSLASVLGDNDGEGDDAVAELRNFGAGRRAGSAMARSSSLPVGQFALGVAGAREDGGRRDREGTALPGARDGSVPPEGAKEGAVEARNKNTVKKLTLARMTALGYGKSHAEFRDVFSFTTRGVGFAMRYTFKSSVLSPVEREHAATLIETHLKLYLPSSSFATPSPTPTLAPDLAPDAVKTQQEPLLPPAIPSPRSLGDGLGAEESAAGVAAACGAAEADVEMEETQLPDDSDEATQLPLEEGAPQAPLAAKRPQGVPQVEEDDGDVDEVVLLLLLISLVFHLAFLPSIFDIYFKTPVVQVTERFSVGTEAGTLAKRVVLFVGDGLRADKLFQTYGNPPFAASDPLPPPIPDYPDALADDVDDATTPAPFLRSLIQSGHAQWGVSHTRVPTESRPGHVALIGGMYEDVSAVTRGWTQNPVPFDSVFNQSSHAFTFGSPDILPMFKLGASDPDRVAAFSYDEEAEDFTADAVHLDLWVLDQLRALLRNASGDPSLHAKLHEPGVVFFEHLLGLDTTGHSYRPHGSEYHRNIRVIDYVVRETFKLLGEFYGDDGQTAFVFTADHGMSALGNHGDGHPDNTRTPLVVWGKGVRPRPDWEEPALHDDYSKDWGLRGVRRDVEQADVAALMSVLAGIPLPANSAGRVPLDYLDASPELRARAALANAQQLLAEVEAKSELKKRHAISFRPFPAFIDSPGDGFHTPEYHRQIVEDLLQSGNYDLAERKSLALADLALAASSYFQKYDWMLLRTLVTLGYLGFMAFTAQSILAGHTPAPSTIPRMTVTCGLPIGAFLSLCARFAIERAPPSYYLYAFWPCAFWLAVLLDPAPFVALFRSTCTRASILPRLFGSTTAVVLSLLAMAYGYTDRRVFALMALGMALVWPATMLDSAWRARNSALLAQWTVTLSALAVFTLLPTEKAEDLATVTTGAALLSCMMVSALRLLKSKNSPTWPRTRRFLLAEVALTAACLVITCSSALSLQRKQGLPAFNQHAGWAVLSVASVLPLLHGRPRGQPYSERLAVLVFAFAPAFVILSLSYEAAFYGVYIAALVAWARIESSLSAEERTDDGRIKLAHVRVGLFFLAFLHFGFFGCGNVASISSFYLEPVYRLMTVFAPFPMGALLLFKLLIPFVALAAVSSVINRRLHLPPLSLFVVGSLLSELLTIFFFFRVTDTGSWLEIGSSITNFVICSLLGLFSSALLAGGEHLMAGTAG